MTTASAIHSVDLPSGEPIPILGQGTWGMAEDARRRDDEIAALRLGVDLGMTLIDTAEMYADGGAEGLIGEALADRRDELFLVDKVLPHNATRSGTPTSCERSLRRLRTDRLDMYLLHWRGQVPLEETIDAFTRLVDRGLIRHWGVSNFDLADLSDLTRIPGGTAFETDQVLYNLTRRGIEWDLLPRCREAGLPIMAYSPFEHGRMINHPTLEEIAAAHRVTPAAVALAWVLRQDHVATIPKAGTPEHVRENRAAYELQLTEEDLAVLDRAFPPPTGPRPLEVL
ncbi:MAG: aldo/keto reductase [Dactylosporangium sp.]|jgi:diketogulonate reductase-like aldo/keto reductase|nr:aldo/keto reductase [Dactylosporangium sp.]